MGSKVKKSVLKKIFCGLFLLIQVFEYVRAMENPNDSLKANQRALQIPQPLSTFKHQIIYLEPSSKNVFPLSLEQADQPVFTDYRWDGKSIAEVITGNKKIFLKSADPRGHNFAIVNPTQTGDLHINLQGKLTLQEPINANTMLVACKSLKNKKNLNATKFLFTGRKLINGGLFNTDNCDVEKCHKILNKNNWIVNKNCRLKEIDYLSTGQGSTWLVGENLAGIVKDVHLEGRTSVGNIAVLGVEKNAIFDNHFDSPILHVESKGRLATTAQAKFFVTHHLGLQAKESLFCQSDIFEKPEHELKTNTSDTVRKLFQDGIFLQSEQSDVYKSGSIQVKNKPICIAAKKELVHNNVTQAGNDQQASLMLTGKQVVLEKESVLGGCSAQLNAEESILQQGKIHLDTLVSEHHETPINTIDSEGLLTLNAKKITTTEFSQIDAKNIYMVATDQINQKWNNQSSRKFIPSCAPCKIRKQLIDYCS